MLKDFFNHIRLVNKADDPHLSLALGAAKRVGFIDFSDKVGTASLTNPARPELWPLTIRGFNREWMRKVKRSYRARGRCGFSREPVSNKMLDSRNSG